MAKKKHTPRQTNGSLLIKPDGSIDFTGKSDSEVSQVVVYNQRSESLDSVNLSSLLNEAQGIDGIDGAPGAPGARGSTGATGAKGPIGDPGGAQGATGPLGATGATGFGATGATGVQGPIGPRGSTGATGFTGPRGSKGDQGAPGLPGSVGLPGPVGPRGSTGATGIGATGPIGPEGATGVQGQRGNSGPPGGPGATGPDGPPGIQGLTGATGAIAAYGPTFSVQYNTGNNEGGGTSELLFDGTTLTATNEIQGDVSGYSRLLNPGRRINGVLFDGTQDITISAGTAGILTMTTVGLGLTGDAVFNGSDTVFTATLNSNASNVPESVVYRDVTGSFLAQDITANGDVVIDGDLTVKGTTTTIDTQDLLVEDKNITIGNVSTPSDVTAEGGGITLLASSPKTISWTNVGDRWVSNVDFAATRYYGPLTGDVTGNVTGDLLGNASSADKVNNTITVSGTGNGLSGTGTFDGSAQVSIDIDSNATSAADPSTLVFRDGSGNFSANSITANLVGNASGSSATLNPGRTINGVLFDGSQNITVSAATVGTLTLEASGLGLDPATATFDGANTTFTVNSNATSTNLPDTAVFRNGAGNFSANNITASLSGNVTGNVDGNASSATQLETARTINGVSFDGTSNITITANTPGTLTVNGSGGITITNNTFNGSANTMTINSNATSTNTVNRIVRRDGNGDFAARRITAELIGNASTSTTSGVAATADSINTTNSYRMRSLGVNTTASGTAGEIRATNDITAFFSDIRLKHNLKKIERPLEKVCAISGVTYEPNELAVSHGFQQEEMVGVIAQEIEAVLPQAVKPAPFDTDFDEDGNPFSISGEEYKTVKYEKLVPLLIEAIKELKAELDDVKRRM